jgi:hypothetical protein
MSGLFGFMFLSFSEGAIIFMEDVGLNCESVFNKEFFLLGYNVI